MEGGGGNLMYFVSLFLAPWYTKCNQIYILQVQQTRFLLHDYAPRELGWNADYEFRIACDLGKQVLKGLPSLLKTFSAHGLEEEFACVRLWSCWGDYVVRLTGQLTHLHTLSHIQDR